MTFAAVFFHRLRWLNVPGALLVMLLQRTPVLRALVAAEEMVAASPAVSVLRSAAVALGSLGALHTLAGATTMKIQQNSTVFVQVGDPPQLNSPIPLTVGTTIAPIFIFTTGAPVPAGSYQIAGLPPGLTAAGANAAGLVNQSTVTINGTPTTAGTFNATVLAWEFSGGPSTPANDRFPETGPVTIRFTVTDGADITPTIMAQPAGQIATLGSNATLSVAATGNPPPAYQWQRNGIAITGATAASLALTNVQFSDAGDYRVVVSNAGGTVTSRSATLSVVIPSSATARLSNLSVRTTLAAGPPLIVGVVVGVGSRNVLVRAAGPALNTFGLTGTMADPRIDLFRDSTLLVSNDDWPSSLAPTFASVGAFEFSVGSKDAALMQNIEGGRSIQVRGTSGGTVLVEAYDTGEPSAARLINVSARNFSGTDTDILTAGFVITGTGSKQLLIRGVGPKLEAFGVGGFLADPKIEVFSGATKLVENDNWDDSLAATFTAVGAFGLDSGSKDAALLISLPPGPYTAQVRGADGGTGEALVEIYEVP